LFHHFVAKRKQQQEKNKHHFPSTKKMELIKNIALKALVTGVYGTVGSIAMGESMSSTASLFGMYVPGPIAIGATTSVGSITADIAHYYVLPWIPGQEKFSTIEGAAVGIAASGFGTMYAQSTYTGTFSKQGFLLGAAAYLAGDYTANYLFPSIGSAVNIWY